MTEDIKSLEAEIMRRFEKAGKTEFVINDKIKLAVTTSFGRSEPVLEVSDLEDPNEGILPLEYAKPKILDAIRDHFSHTTPETNPFMVDLPDDDSEDSLDKNPFID